jgi:hypothetical protein
MATPTLAGTWGASASLALLLAASIGTVSAATSSSAHRYSITGELTADAADARDDRPTVKAQLIEGSTTTLQAGSGFSLSATLASSPLVCATDLIFRNGFDIILE